MTYLSYMPPLLACYMTCNFVSLTPSLVLFLSQFYAPTFCNLYNSSSVGEAVNAHAPVDRNHLFKDPLVSILSEVLFNIASLPSRMTSYAFKHMHGYILLVHTHTHG